MYSYNKDSEQIFRLLVSNYRDKVIRFISLFVQDDCACEELASDVFISLWSQWEKITEISRIDNYIFVIAKNKALNYLRKEQRETVDMDSLHIDSFYCTETTPESIYISKETAAALNKAINELPHRTKLAFLLVRENKKTYKEAAEILGVSVKTIEKQVASAVEKLRERLKQWK
ncbi:MAG: sigma-70 family RNA polymerase sigma factor [Dysgonamonadaceae bacterium]|jgi:RNA polymerase sigma-70 factor (ECF subfamily)|nr:sigma-70 family RNA polymerase sigma factor [Dysgonamonadaceae bacterium]